MQQSGLFFYSYSRLQYWEVCHKHLPWDLIIWVPAKELFASSQISNRNVQQSGLFFYSSSNIQYRDFCRKHLPRDLIIWMPARKLFPSLHISVPMRSHFIRGKWGQQISNKTANIGGMRSHDAATEQRGTKGPRTAVDLDTTFRTGLFMFTKQTRMWVLGFSYFTLPGGLIMPIRGPWWLWGLWRERAN